MVHSVFGGRLHQRASSSFDEWEARLNNLADVNKLEQDFRELAEDLGTSYTRITVSNGRPISDTIFKVRIPVISDGAGIGRISYRITLKEKPSLDMLEFVPAVGLASPSDWQDMLRLVIEHSAKAEGLQRYVCAVRGFSCAFFDNRDEHVLTRGNEHQDLKSTVRLLYDSVVRYAKVARLPEYAASVAGVVAAEQNLATAKQGMERTLQGLLSR